MHTTIILLNDLLCEQMEIDYKTHSTLSIQAAYCYFQ